MLLLVGEVVLRATSESLGRHGKLDGYAESFRKPSPAVERELLRPQLKRCVRRVDKYT